MLIHALRGSQVRFLPVAFFKMIEVYEPAEDSYLLSEVLASKIPRLLNVNFNLKFLEIGAGSGINLQAAFSSGIKKENIFSCDINEEAVKYCKKLGFNCALSDLFSNIPKQKFDLIIFNPPYLPLDKREPKSSRVSTTSGKKGNEIIIRFLKHAKDFLDKDGSIFIITSSLSEQINFNKLGYKAKEISSKNLFFEKLSVWECLKI